jgi:uncharacterized Tic20 family protein
MSASSKIVNPVRKHKRDVWLKIIIPIALPFVGLVALVVILAAAVATDALVSKQITIMMSILATCFLALPAVVLCLVPYALLAATAALAGKGYAHAQTPLRFVRRTTEKIAARTDEYVPRLAGPLLALNVRLTRWEKTLSSWLQLDNPKDETHG